MEVLETSMAAAATGQGILDESLQQHGDVQEEHHVGCFIDDHEIYLIQNHDVVVQQIQQWLIVIILPITTIIFVYAGWQAQRTHGFGAFDSMVLYLCAIYNLFQLYQQLITCTPQLMFVQMLYVTSMILYLFYNFEALLEQLAQDNEEIR